MSVCLCLSVSVCVCVCVCVCVSVCLCVCVCESEAHATRVLLALPVARGGIGLRQLALICDAAHCASWLQCASAVASTLGTVAPAVGDWSSAAPLLQKHVHAAAGRLRDEYAIDFSELEHPKLQTVFSKAVLERKCKHWRATATLRSLQVALPASSTCGHAGAGYWLHAMPLSDALTLSDDVYLFTVPLRLGLPLVAAGGTCCVFNQTSRRLCGCQLTAEVDHAPGCAKSERNERHNALRDWWLSVACADVRASYGPGTPSWSSIPSRPACLEAPVESCSGRSPARSRLSILPSRVNAWSMLRLVTRTELPSCQL